MAESRTGSADPARVCAGAILRDVLGRGRSLTAALDARRADLAQPADRAFVQELVFGVMRWLPRLEALTDALLKQPLRSRDLDVQIVLLLGLFQLIETRVPERAVVHASVELARKTRKPWAGGLVNAVLRRWLRESWPLDDGDACPDLLTSEARRRIRYAHPDWLLDRLAEDWPDYWQALCAANNQRPPMTLRVNRSRAGREAWLRALRDAGLSGSAHPVAVDAVVLERPCPVSRLPGFAEGLVSVQDAASQLAAILLAPESGQRVLDACAAPGSKTCHLLERYPDLERVTAVDVDGDRLERLHESASRLGLAETDRLEVKVADAGNPADWWDGQGYHRILLDAPCSATGVIRRHPDIKRLRRSGDIATLAAMQRRLLEALWPLLLPGGMLLYSTCSVLRAENGHIINAFLAHQADARVQEPILGIDPLETEWGFHDGTGRQVITGTMEMDGFYYGLLVKSPRHA